VDGKTSPLEAIRLPHASARSSTSRKIYWTIGTHDVKLAKLKQASCGLFLFLPSQERVSIARDSFLILSPLSS